MTEYKVALDVYSGPLDLLLFLIRREEIDIHNIPIARITQQYVEHLDLLALVDPEVVGDFLVLAATLMEIKSRTLLPSPPADEGEDELVDPRSELIRQLLEYKRFKDAAHQLEDDAAERAMKFSRMPGVLPTVEEELELENLQVWDLFDAFRRLLEQTGQTDPVHQVGIDDTPIALHADDILDVLSNADENIQFETVFVGRDRATMIGLLLALLELIRQQRVSVRQDKAFGPIWIVLLDPTPLDQASFASDEGESGSPDMEEQPDEDGAISTDNPVVAVNKAIEPDQEGTDHETEPEAG